MVCRRGTGVSAGVPTAPASPAYATDNIFRAPYPHKAPDARTERPRAQLAAKRAGGTLP
jgi:hypothetical protein